MIGNGLKPSQDMLWDASLEIFFPSKLGRSWPLDPWSGRLKMLKEESRGSTISQHGNSHGNGNNLLQHVNASYSITIERLKTLLTEVGMNWLAKHFSASRNEDEPQKVSPMHLQMSTFELVLLGHRQRCCNCMYFHHQLCWDSCTATDLS